MSEMDGGRTFPAVADPSCPGCRDGDPLLLPCGHRLCAACLALCRRELGERACTVCYGRDVLDGVVKGLLDSLFQGRSRRDAAAPPAGDRRSCPLHGEKLTLFCMEDERPLCSLCKAAEHQEHECCSSEEAVQDCKREFRTTLRILEEKLEALNVAKQTCDEMAVHIKNQSLQTERLAKEEFEKLHQFLHDEEEALVATLKEEEEEKTLKIQEKIEKLAGEIASLSETMKMVEEQLEADDISLLQNFKTTVQSAQSPPREADKPAGLLIDVAKHLGCLKHRVWEKMQGITQYTPVVLDPNTADVCLELSDDLTTVRNADDDQGLPDNPERFSYYECALGSEGLGAGRHAWEVEVGDSAEWALGVAKETVPRKEWFPMSPETGLWSIGLYAGEYRARAPVSAPIAVKKKPHRVRVQLDWDRGRLAFSDSSDNTLLFKYQHRFTEKVFPYFSNASKRNPLRILPGKVSVAVD